MATEEAMRRPCKTCKDRRRNNGQPSRILATLPTKTQVKKLDVQVCRYCDGPVFQLASQKQ